MNEGKRMAVDDGLMRRLEEVCRERGIGIAFGDGNAIYNEGTIAYCSITNTLVICDTATDEDLLATIDYIERRGTKAVKKCRK